MEEMPDTTISANTFPSTMADRFTADVVGKCCDYESFLGQYDTAVAALGDNNMRLHWTEKLMEAGYDVPAIIHPSAVVSPSASVGKGSFIMQKAIVNTHTVVEHGVLINSGAVVDHDSYVERGAHIGLGSVVKANCRIASKVKVEAGEVIFSTRRKIDGVEDRNLEDAIYAFGFGNRCSYVKPFGAGFHICWSRFIWMEVLCIFSLSQEPIRTVIFPRTTSETIFTDINPPITTPKSYSISRNRSCAYEYDLVSVIQYPNLFVFINVWFIAALSANKP